MELCSSQDEIRLNLTQTVEIELLVAEDQALGRNWSGLGLFKPPKRISYPFEDKKYFINHNIGKAFHINIKGLSYIYIRPYIRISI